jgi:hypothetical protein
VAIVPPESKGKTEGNDWDTACGNFKHQFIQYITIKNVFVLLITKIILKLIIPLLFGGDIYRQHATTFSRLA